ncbi:MAG: Fe-S cluster assembly protein NifU [Candidatus Aureabacteria bacterium]|nr:Fe-S cluster assembly protein NifU [Candidatus Auribacterota bacterium]
MWNYTEKVMEHFLHPRNAGEIKDADAVGEVGNMACGDALKLYLKLDKGKRIADAKFQTFGCASAIASASALTEIIKGKTLEEAEKVTNDDIAAYLGGLPKEKMHCSVMGQEALEAAITSYRGGKPAPQDEGRIVCTCFGVTDSKIARVVREHKLTTPEQVTHYCKAGGGCGGCVEEIQAIIDEVWRKESEKKARAGFPAAKPMTNIQKIQLIQETIEKEIKPALRADGGDIELIDVVGNRVQVAFRGGCAECPASGVTIAAVVEKKLREFVSPEITVQEVKDENRVSRQ